MKVRGLLCCALTCAAIVTASAGQRTPAQSDQAVLENLERSWNAAFYRHDIAAIKNFLADEFISTYDDGARGDKAKELQLASEFNQAVESAEPDEFTIKIYGDTAVVWFTLKITGLKQGKPSVLTLRYTDVWVLRDGRWQCVSAHSTRVTSG
jgi:ketosteroid isomerase-like protein